jgi:hypothetical protein
MIAFPGVFREASLGMMESAKSQPRSKHCEVNSDIEQAGIEFWKAFKGLGRAYPPSGTYQFWLTYPVPLAKCTFIENGERDSLLYSRCDRVP